MMPSGEFARIATYAVPGAFALGGLAAGIAVRSMLVPVIARAATRAATPYPRALVDAVRNPVVIWSTLLGLHVAGELLPFAVVTHQGLRTAAGVALILSVAWAAARFTSLAVLAATVTPTTPHGVSLIGNLARLALLLLGLLVALDTAGIKITPIITAFGIGGLAVGLALQDTLANFFAGIRLLVSHTLRTGDFVRLETGEEGIVRDIGWGRTTILQGLNNVVVVPNTRLASAVTTNYSLPEPAQEFAFVFTVAMGSDLARVEQVALQVALEVQRETEGAVTDFEPRVRFREVTVYGVPFAIVLRGRDNGVRVLLLHQLVKRLQARFAREGIRFAESRLTADG
jgi:small-conductance mechanosensitive channel